MWMNLFAVFPTTDYTFSMYRMMRVMFSVPELMLHMMIGVLIGLISIIIFMLFAMKGGPALTLLAAFASIFILIAGIGGLEFMFSGFTNNVFSYFMSIGFIFSVLIYSLILYMISLYGR